MGIEGKQRRSIRPPLPAPTESMDEGGNTSGIDTDVGTILTTRTDKSSYEIPEDGSPITISTQKVTGRKEQQQSSQSKSQEGRSGGGGLASHGRQKSQTSLLIEYFEASKSGSDKTKARPSVRVKVTPSSRKKSGSGASPGAGDAVQITGIGKDRVPSYTRRISLSGGRAVDAPTAAEGTEISNSSGSNGSARGPVEIEVMQGGGSSDVSNASRGLMYAPMESNVSSMPPDSMLEGRGNGRGYDEEESSTRGLERDDETPVPDAEYLKAPLGARERSSSRDRITQKVMEKLGQTSTRPRKSSAARSEGAYSYESEPYERSSRRRSGKSQQYEDETAERGLKPQSYYSGSSDLSRASKISSNNPKLLNIVEDTIKRMIMPELDALKAEQRGQSSSPRYDKLGGLERRVSKSSSTPNISSRPKVVLNRDDNDPGTVLSRGDSERRTRDPSYSHRPSSRRSSGKHSDRYTEEDDQTVRQKSSRGSSSRKLRDAEAAGAGVVGAGLTAAALRQHDSQEDMPRRRKRRSKSRSSRSRSESHTDPYNTLGSPERDIPPMPLASNIHESDITRESIMSADTDRPKSQSGFVDSHTPVREVSRGSLGELAKSPASSRTPPVSRGLGMSHGNRSIEKSQSPVGSSSSKGRLAALGAAAGAAALGGAAVARGVESPSRDRHVDADGYGSSTPPQRKLASPAQSVSSLRKTFEDESLVPQGLRPSSAASRSSASRLRGLQNQPSLQSDGSPKSGLSRSRHSSRDLKDHSEYITPQERILSQSQGGIARESSATPGTPTRGESVDDWYERQHRLNERYRDSLDQEQDIEGDFNRDATNRDSYLTNPYPQDERGFRPPLSHASSNLSAPEGDEADVRGGSGLGENPRFIHSPHGAESAVASLLEPSNVSSGDRAINRLSEQSFPSPTTNVNTSNRNIDSNNRGSYSERMASHLRNMNQETPPMYEGSTISQTMPSQDRWAAIRGHARAMSASTNAEGDSTGVLSPRQSPAKSLGALDEDPLEHQQERGLEDSGQVKSREFQQQQQQQQPRMGASGLPDADDPMPEIGHYVDDGKSEADTAPSVISGMMGGKDANKDASWSYSPEQDDTEDARAGAERDLASTGGGKSDGRMAAGVVAGGAAAATAAAALAGAKALQQPSVEDVKEQQDERRLTPEISRAAKYARSRDAASASPAGGFRDEGYGTDNYARSAEALPANKSRARPETSYGKKDLGEYERAMDAQDTDDEDNDDDGTADPFTVSAKHARHMSANSHGMASPLYDSATGKGKDHIQSKDIVALMDHLTVRDAQRNARDTEILVSIVRSAAEMRQSFDEMKKFIVEQDRIIMQNAERGNDETVKRVLGGPRPLPGAAGAAGSVGGASIGSPRTTPRKQSEEEMVQSKRKGVLRRALRGLTGGKNASDLARVEGMLNQILDNVEDLKLQQGGGPGGDAGGFSTGGDAGAGGARGLQSSSQFDQADALRPAFSRSEYTSDSLDSYEKLRNVPDPGYEPEGQAGTSSTPSHSGYLSNVGAASLSGGLSRGEKQQFHSGYDGRRGSENRVSTVLEGDEEDDNGDLEPHEAHVLNHQFENNERMLSPTQELNARRGFGTPPRGAYYGGGSGGNGGARGSDDFTPRSAADKQRLHKSLSPGAPKVSRWSKTTTSSAAPDSTVPESPVQPRNARPISDASGSNRSLGAYNDDGMDDEDETGRYTPRARDQVQQTQQQYPEEESRSLRSSRHNRTPSPLIPSEASSSLRHAGSYDHYANNNYNEGDMGDRGVSPIQIDPEFDDPKYQAHRNSLLLQHPQPRAGPTGRHQNTLETQAHTFDDPSRSTSNSDVSGRSAGALSGEFDPAMWGSLGTAGLAKHRLSQIEPISPVSLNSPRGTAGGAGYGRGKGADDGPLVPTPQQGQQSRQTYSTGQQQQQQQRFTSTSYNDDDDDDDDDEEDEWEQEEPTYSNSGFSRGGPGYYSSPFGSGHLLEPIEEVRYSLETDSGHISPEPQLGAAQAVDMRSSARKITGPRPMGGGAAAMTGTATRSPATQQARLVDATAALTSSPVSPSSPTVRRKPVSSSGGGLMRGGAGSAETFGSDTF